MPDNSSPQDAFQTAFRITILVEPELTPKQIRLPRLTVSDLGEIGQMIVETRKQSAIKLHQEANKSFPKGKLIDAYEMMAIMQQIVDRVPSINDHLMASVTPEGATRYLLYSMEKAKYTKPEMDEVLRNIDAEAFFAAAQALVSCKPAQHAKDDQQGDSNKNPLAGGRGNSPAGSSTTPGSGDTTGESSGENSLEAPPGFGNPNPTVKQKAKKTGGSSPTGSAGKSPA